MAFTDFIAGFGLPATILANPWLSTLLPVAVGTAVGFSTMPHVKDLYPQLRQPPGKPPRWAFGPVWTALYASMGYAAHRAFTAGLSSPNLAVRDRALLGAGVYSLQLLLNLAWMPLFFRARQPLVALADSTLLWGSVAWLVGEWMSVDEVAGWLLVPYLGWVTYATYLNAGFYWLNFTKEGKKE
ncbi:translocator protein [Saitoella complicata NRRL Y-17804]|uniref:TspO/MBR-related protein n=1 Tax=Saitoella complicata (strain BCRC 22490 / CBS 7301 / JCM 7358 / NBRC 10748 / NRRL Y-17804) TaxID=698492 RepID=A0A0E9NLU2_SAICN|nr:translocator protein [Saitoella complicata NRRL Y-17804]ODQ55512.1 translocator protein [Saitoella complicata NRRL Y-17804]GAO50773.1 hypothetical protein G7K_4894-t1 [Saitoella complicata NRRL Y-17804]